MGQLSSLGVLLFLPAAQEEREREAAIRAPSPASSPCSWRVTPPTNPCCSCVAWAAAPRPAPAAAPAAFAPPALLATRPPAAPSAAVLPAATALLPVAGPAAAPLAAATLLPLAATPAPPGLASAAARFPLVQAAAPHPATVALPVRPVGGQGPASIPSEVPDAPGCLCPSNLKSPGLGRGEPLQLPQRPSYSKYSPSFHEIIR